MKSIYIVKLKFIMGSNVTEKYNLFDDVELSRRTFSRTAIAFETMETVGISHNSGYFGGI